MRRCWETGLAERVRAPPTPIQNSDCQAHIHRFRAITQRKTAEPLPTLLLEYLFDLADLFLNFAGVLFGVAFGL